MNKKRNKKRVFRRILPLILAMVLCITTQDMTAFAQTADIPALQAQDADISTGDIISYGSYPQTEVTGNALTNEIINAEYDENGDAVVNGQKYRRYKESVGVTKDDYKGYVTTYYPTRYGTNYWDDDYTYNYTQNWNSAYLEECQKQKTEDKGTYRYFKWEPIKWKVLENETEEGTLFVMADTVLDARNYHGEYSDYNEYPATVSWENSDLCQWMNMDAAGFYQMAFDSSEKENIKVSDENPGNKPVYLLSDEEVKNTEYGFEDTDSNSKSRVMYASAYAQARGAAVYNKYNLQCSWFLRTPGQSYYVKNVSLYGGIYNNMVRYYKAYQWNPNTSMYERSFNGCLPVMHIDASSVAQDSDETGVKNFDYTFTSLDGASVSTSSDSGQATVIIFGRTGCVNSRNTIKSIAASQWVHRSDIRVIFAECDFSSSEEVQSFADTYGSDDIIFCYDTGTNIYNAAWAYYYRFYDSNAFIMPLTVVIDGENQIRNCLTGYQTAAAIRSLMDEFVAADPSESDNEKTIKAEFDVTYGQTEARQMLSRINEFRTGDGAWEWDSKDTAKIYHTGLSGLTYDYELEKVAMQRAADLVASYSHTRPDGTDCFSAYPSEFSPMVKGENIAIGYRTEEAVFEGWKEENEPYSGQGHRRNMLSEKYQAVGIAHVVYNGCHYWVQEFSSGVVSDAETLAIDNEKTVNVTISKDLISKQDLKLSEDDIQMEAWAKQELPRVYLEIRTTGTWSKGPSLELPVTAEWSISSGEDVVRISEDSLYALKEGDARVTASYNDKTTEIQVTVASNPAAEKVEERLKEYESKLVDYPEKEKEELQTLLETIKGEIEAARAEGDLEAAEAALAKMEAALEEKAAGKKEEAKQELERLKDSITTDEKLDNDQRAEIEDILRETETVIENAKDATAVKEALEDAQQKIEAIKNMSPELKQARETVQQQIDAWNEAAFLAKYGEAERTEIKKIADKLAADINGKTEPEEIQKLLGQAKAEVSALKTEEQKALEQKEADKNKQDGTGTETGTSAATLTLSQSKATLYTGKVSKTVIIKATVTGGTSQKVTWISSNQNVATVMDGTITAVKKGTATITATANGINKTVTVTVKDPALTIKKNGKKYTKKKLTVKKGKKVILTVTVSPKKSGISIAKVTKKIANVTLKGSKITIMGRKKGTFTLKIKSGETTKKIKITVK